MNTNGIRWVPMRFSFARILRFQATGGPPVRWLPVCVNGEAMRSCVYLLVLALLLGSSANILNAAERQAIRMMAGILMNLTHSPSHADRQALEKILVDDNATTLAERVVAEALLHVRHTVRPEDKAKLEALIADRSLPASITILAIVLVTFTHTVTEAQREELKPLAVDQCEAAVARNATRDLTGGYFVTLVA
jgi:hypothetical protein